MIHSIKFYLVCIWSHFHIDIINRNDEQNSTKCNRVVGCSVAFLSVWIPYSRIFKWRWQRHQRRRWWWWLWRQRLYNSDTFSRQSVDKSLAPIDKPEIKNGCVYVWVCAFANKKKKTNGSRARHVQYTHTVWRKHSLILNYYHSGVQYNF